MNRSDLAYHARYLSPYFFNRFELERSGRDIGWLLVPVRQAMEGGAAAIAGARRGEFCSRVRCSASQPSRTGAGRRFRPRRSYRSSRRACGTSGWPTGRRYHPGAAGWRLRTGNPCSPGLAVGILDGALENEALLSLVPESVDLLNVGCVDLDCAVNIFLKICREVQIALEPVGHDAPMSLRCCHRDNPL